MGDLDEACERRAVRPRERPLSLGPAIRPGRLTADARRAFEDRLYAVHRRIFSEPGRRELRRMVMDNGAHETRIRIYRNAAGEDVGYVALHVFLLAGGLRPTRVLRTQAGLLPEYRRYNSSFRLLFWECVFHFVSRGFPETYFFGTFVSPTPYALACRHLDQVYPRPEGRTPARFRDAMRRMVDAFDLGSHLPDLPYCHPCCYVSRFPAAHQERVWRSEDPWVRFFLEQNPYFESGHGMSVLVPFNLRNGWCGLWNLLRRRLRRGRRAATAWRRPLGRLRAALLR